MNRTALIGACAAGLLLATAASAQPPAPPTAAPPPPPAPQLIYGPNITLEQAMQVAAGANAEAARRKMPATIAIVDTSGAMVYFQRGANAPGTAEAFATRKAVAAVKERHPTSADQTRLQTAPAATPFLPDFFPFGGGIPIVIDGKIAGAIGETGGADEDVARAGASAVR
jgi:glc operon protein GlcG